MQDVTILASRARCYWAHPRVVKSDVGLTLTFSNLLGTLCLLAMSVRAMLLLDNSTEVRFGPYGLAYPALASQLEAFGLTQDNYVWRKVCFTSAVTMFFALSAPSDTCRLYLVVSRGISWCGEARKAVPRSLGVLCAWRRPLQSLRACA